MARGSYHLFSYTLALLLDGTNIGLRGDIRADCSPVPIHSCISGWTLFPFELNARTKGHARLFILDESVVVLLPMGDRGVTP